MKKFLSLFVVALFAFFLSPKVYAGSLSIKASSTTVTEGGSVTITVSASGLAGKFSISSSNGNVLSGGTSNEWLENESKSYRFTAKSVGSATITVSAIDVADSSSNSKFTGSRSVTVQVVKPREKSNNNYLSNLWIDGFSLTPEFSKDQSDYQVEVPAETEKVQIQASKEDSYSSIQGTGEFEVSEGENRFEIKVVSETGKERVYVVIVSVKDNHPIEVLIDEETYTVVKKASSLTCPSLFEETKVKIQDTEVPGFYNKNSDITLVGLRGKDSKIFLAIYDSHNQSYTKYQPVTSKVSSIVSLPVQKFKNFSKVTFQIGEETYEGYQLSAKSPFVYLYGLSIDTGEKSWYVYDKEEGTIQRYQEEELDAITKNYEEKIDENKKVILLLGGTSILLLLVILILVLKRKSHSRKAKYYLDIESEIKDTKENETEDTKENEKESEDEEAFSLEEEKPKEEKKKKKKKKK